MKHNDDITTLIGLNVGVILMIGIMFTPLSHESKEEPVHSSTIAVVEEDGRYRELSSNELKERSLLETSSNRVEAVEIENQIPTGTNYYQAEDSFWEVSVKNESGEYEVNCYERGTVNVDKRFTEDTVWVEDDPWTLMNQERTIVLQFEDYGAQLFLLDLERKRSVHYYRVE